jgi:hypothetical protein
MHNKNPTIEQFISAGDLAFLTAFEQDSENNNTVAETMSPTTASKMDVGCQ